MLITESYYLPCTVAISIVSLIIFYFLLREKLSKKVLAYSGITFTLLVIITLKSLGSKVYVVDENLNVKQYVAIGSFTIPMKGEAAEISCTVPFNRVGVVNQSKKILVIEGINYGNNSYSTVSQDDQIIQSMTFEVVFLNRGYISYFFDDRIPEEIRSVGYSSQETKYWLHEFEK